jgi:hypothetical protein
VAVLSCPRSLNLSRTQGWDNIFILGPDGAISKRPLIGEKFRTSKTVKELSGLFVLIDHHL